MVTWHDIRIGDLGRVVTGKTPPTSMPECFGTAYPFITPSDITFGHRHVETERALSEFGKERQRSLLIPPDTICVVCIGSIGKICMADRPSFTNQQVNSVVVDTSRYDPHFVYYLLSTIGERLASQAGGAATPIVNKSAFSDIAIRVPDTSSQISIGRILGAYDDLIENNTKRIKILEEMARSLYREWFVHFRFPGHEKVRMVDSALGKVPEGWELKPIHHFGRVITGKTPSKANADLFGDHMPFVKTPDMHGNTFILGTSEQLSMAGAASQSSKTLPAGAICVSCIGTIGIVSITTENCQTNQQINSVVLSSDTFLELLFFRIQDAKQTLKNLGANGATMGNVNKGKFEAIEIISPPNSILVEYHERTQPMFAEILTLSRQIQNLRRTRDLLLPRLISGEIEPNDQREPSQLSKSA